MHPSITVKRRSRRIFFTRAICHRPLWFPCGAMLVVAAVIVAGVVSLALQGDYAYVGRAAASLDLPPGLPAVLAHGVSRTVCPRPLYKQLARSFKTPH